MTTTDLPSTATGAESPPDLGDDRRVRLRDDTSAVLRLSEAEANAFERDPDDRRMIMNMGPQHPSTHGVLRLMLELEGETVRRCKPVIGYLHTGMEKTGEELSYLQGPTNVTRMDYSSPLFNELVFSMATEELLGIEVPERARSGFGCSCANSTA